MLSDALFLYSLSGLGNLGEFVLAIGVLLVVFDGAILVGRIADRFLP